MVSFILCVKFFGLLVNWDQTPNLLFTLYLQKVFKQSRDLGFVKLQESHIGGCLKMKPYYFIVRFDKCSQSQYIPCLVSNSDTLSQWSPTCL